MQLIGTRKQAQQFAYRLELNGHRRRLTWEATPRSIHEGVSRLVDRFRPLFDQLSVPSKTRTASYLTRRLLRCFPKTETWAST